MRSGVTHMAANHHHPATPENSACDPLSFDHQMSLKLTEAHDDVSDEAWYVAMVAHWTLQIEGLQVPAGYKFSIEPPNPDIVDFYSRRVPAHIAAIELFSLEALMSKGLLREREVIEFTLLDNKIYVAALSVERAMLSGGLRPGKDYQALDLYRLAMPLALDMFKSDPRREVILGEGGNP